MYKTFNITISDQYKKYTLPFDIYNSKIAQKWASEVAQNYNLYERNRFKSWKVDPDKEEKIVSLLNKQINIINDYFNNYIELSIKRDTTQETLNYLHKCFELLRGNIIRGTDKFNNAPTYVQSAIENLNIYIHQYEDFIRSQPSSMFPDHPFASIVGTFSNRPRYKLEDKDYDHFTFSWKFGEVYINYCEVGKPILDVFKDNDKIVGRENIRPLHYYSADFMIKFGPDIPTEYIKKRKRDIKNWLKEQDIEYNKYLSIGLIPVAKLSLNNFDDLKQKEIVKKYSNCNYLEMAWVEQCTK